MRPGRGTVFSAIGLLVGGQIVHDDDIAFFEGWDELGLDIGFEDSAVHRRIDDEGRGEGAATQSGDKGLGLPMAEKGFGPEAPSPFRQRRAGASFSSWSRSRR